MNDRGVLTQAEVPASLLTDLDSRDVAVWMLDSYVKAVGPKVAAHMLRLPWAFVLSENADRALVDALESSEAIDSALVRRRGIIHVVDTNPSDVILPPRSLPIFLLNGRSAEPSTGLAALTRRLTMLEQLKRRSIKHLVMLAGPHLEIPLELGGLWADGFRAYVTVISDAPEAANLLTAWRAQVGAPPIFSLVTAADATAAESLVQRFTDSRDDRLILRLRDANGAFHRLDVSGLDDPEHPLIGRYELLTDDLLSPLLPSDLRAEEVEGFFKNPRASWRPFAAGMPWPRELENLEMLRGAMRKLDREGVEFNRLFFVSSESGAGATTFVRDIAWRFASEGYPTLVASPPPFAPTGIEVASYMSRCLEAATNAGIGEDTRLYQAPWLIVFDRVHWDGKEGELISFLRELEKSGRRACVIFVTGPYLPITLHGDRRFEPLASLTHRVTLEDAGDLGHHLDPYLRSHGATRSQAEWENFFAHSAVATHQGGIATFWIALSFWLQRQFDLGETIQAWIYRQFRTTVGDAVLQEAIIAIAAMSTEHQLLPESLLPPSKDWPTADRLSDVQRDLGALGIVRVTSDTGRYWGLIHDILGRLLLTALFYDKPARDAAGLGEALNPEHLRLLVLRRIATLPALARNDLREVANAFATSVFKIDPDHGRALFAPYWREALAALDEMPRAFRTTSRTFLHHTAVSRRRIAKAELGFHIDESERVQLLARAIDDIELALGIAPEDGGESDLNLLNSLAHGYHDLAEVEAKRRAPPQRVEALLAKGRDATRRAYRLNPDNSFVIETYARDLLSGARSDPQVAAGNAIEVLGIVYSAMQRHEGRREALGRLADTAFDILLERGASLKTQARPESESEAIIWALRALVDDVIRFEGMRLSDYPSDNRKRAAALLADPMLLGNAQAVRLRYLLTCLDRPLDFALQLELLEALEGSAGSFTPQMDLELAILLHQRDRHHEATRKFQALRRLWQQEEHYVEVPARLKWLLIPDKPDRRQVHARVSISGDGRYRAKVRELQEGEAVFRAPEFGQDKLKPGMPLNGYVSFGHNGPFLRPLTAS